MQENQTMEEYKKDKRELEESIKDKLNNFNKKYNCEIMNINFHTETYNPLGKKSINVVGTVEADISL